MSWECISPATADDTERRVFINEGFADSTRVTLNSVICKFWGLRSVVAIRKSANTSPVEAVRERVVPVMTKRERQEQGELPENIDCSTDLYFRFLLGTPAQGRLLRDMLSWTLVKQEDRGSDGVVQEYWSSSEKRYYPLRKLATQLDFKAIREDRLAKATRIAREKGWTEGRMKGEDEGRLKGVAEGEPKVKLRVRLKASCWAGRKQRAPCCGRGCSKVRRVFHPSFPGRDRGPEGELIGRPVGGFPQGIC